MLFLNNLCILFFLRLLKSSTQTYQAYFIYYAYKKINDKGTFQD